MRERRAKVEAGIRGGGENGGNFWRVQVQTEEQSKKGEYRRGRKKVEDYRTLPVVGKRKKVMRTVERRKYNIQLRGSVKEETEGEVQKFKEGGTYSQG